MKKILLTFIMMVSSSFAFTFPTYYVYNGQNFKLSLTNTSYSNRICTYSNFTTGSINYFYNFSNGSITSIQAFYRTVDSTICSELKRSGNGYVENSAFYYLDLGTCESPKIINSFGECVDATPTCTSNEQLDTATNICVCKGGYNRDYTGTDDNNLEPLTTCSPKKKCPDTMKYFWTDQATDILGFQTEYYDCVPRTDLSEADCLSAGGTYLNIDSDGASLNDKYISIYGLGCIDSKFVHDDVYWQNFSFLMSGFILHGVSAFPMKLASKAVKEDQLLLTYKQNNANLLTYEPEITDLVMGSDGVYAEIGLTAKNASTDAETLTAYNQFLKDNGYISSSSEIPYLPVNDLGIDSSVSSAMNNMYKGGDEVSFSDAILGASKIADKSDSFATMDESLNIGATKTSSIDLSSLLNNASNTKSFPVTSTVLEKTTSAAGEVTTKTLSKINYPDGTYSNVTTLATKFSDATTKYDIAISTPISTTNGTKTIEQSYTVTKNASGTTTNTITTKEPTITYTDSSGHTTTASNSSVDTATADKDLTTPLDLTNIQNALNQMNKTLTETKTLIKDAIEYVPANKADFDLALLNFKKGFSDFGLSLKDFLNFVGALPPIIDGFGDQLKDLLAMFDDKPDFSLPTGSCPFTAHWYGKYHEVDPCRYVYPYRPILVVFLTFFASWVIFLFVFKFMFRVNLRGE